MNKLQYRLASWANAKSGSNTFPVVALPSSCTVAHESKTLYSQFGDGYEYRKPDGLNCQRCLYTLTWQKIANNEADIIESFLTARKGAETFVWEVPFNKKLMKVLCDLSSLKRSYAAGDRSDIQTTFIEVHEA